MKVNKENMIDMLNKVIDRERANIKNINQTPSGVHDMDMYLKGYVRALENLRFMIGVNGE